MLWFRPGTVGSCIGQRANFGNGDVRSFLGRVERYHEGGLALTLRPLACSLPSAVSGRRLAVPPLSCHSRLPPLIKHPANPANTAGIDFAHPHSPATTTRSNRGFELSQRVRLSKMVMRNPCQPLQPLHRRRNCKSKTTIYDGTRRWRCRKPGASPC